MATSQATRIRAFVVGSAVWNAAEFDKSGRVTKTSKPGQVKLHFVKARNPNEAERKVLKEVGPHATSERKIWFIEDSAFLAQIKRKVSTRVRKCFAENGHPL